jgi:hypothetical protein
VCAYLEVHRWRGISVRQDPELRKKKTAQEAQGGERGETAPKSGEKKQKPDTGTILSQNGSEMRKKKSNAFFFFCFFGS